MDDRHLEALLEELIVGQRKALLNQGRRLIPHLTSDDILQPNDFVELEFNPHFRYEEGILTGLLAVQAAVRFKNAEEG